MNQNAAEIISDAARQGVKLWVEDGKLRFRTEHGKLPDELRAAIKANRSQIMDELEHGGSSSFQAHPEDAHQPFPLTDVQSAYLLGRRDSVSGGGVSCHAYFEIGARELEVADIQRAYETVVAAHDALRTRFDEAGFQQVLPVGQVEVPRIVEAHSDDESALLDLREQMSHMVHDASVPPLMGIGYSTHGSVRTVHVSIDFLVADWTGIMRILDDLFEVAHGRSLSQEPARITFRDYVLALQAEDDSEAREYWQGRLGDIALGADVPMCSGEWEKRFTRLECTLDETEWERFRTVAQSMEVSPSALLLALYAQVISFWSAQERNAITVTLFNRRPYHEDVSKLVGDFTSTGFAVLGSSESTLRELAHQAAGELMAIVEHSAYSGVKVIRDVVKQLDGETPSYPFVFTSAVADDRSSEFEHSWSIDYGITQTPQVGIDFQAATIGGALHVNWDVRAGVLAPGVPEAMFDAFRRALSDAASGAAPAGEPLAVALPAAQGAARAAHQAALDAAAEGRAWAPGLLQDAFLARAAEDPAAPAVAGPGAASATRGELAAMARAAAAALGAAGVEPGSRVGVCAGRGASQVACAYGALLAGCAYVPLSPTVPEARRARIAERAGLSALLRDSAAPWWGGAAIAAPRPGDEAPAGWEPPAQAAPAEPAYVIFTSGSTGEPKGVVVSHAAALNTIRDVCARFQVGPSDVALAVSGLDFDLSVFDLFGVLGAGGSLAFCEQGPIADPARWTAAAREAGATVWNSSPAQMTMALDAGEPGLPPTLRLALLSGDWVPADSLERVRRWAPGATVAALGGATEAAIWSNVHVMDGSDAARPSVPYGAALTGQRMEVAGPGLRARPDLVPGEIVISGAGLAEGYLGRDDLTAAAFVEGPGGERWYRTGDVGRWLPCGEIEFLGRRDTQVKIRGNRIELAEIEAVAQTHPGVAEACALVIRPEGAQPSVALVVRPERRYEADLSGRVTAIDGCMATVERLLTRRAKRSANGLVSIGQCVSSVVYRAAMDVSQAETGIQLNILDLRSSDDALPRTIMDAVEGFDYVYTLSPRSGEEREKAVSFWADNPRVRVIDADPCSEEVELRRDEYDIVILPEDGASGFERYYAPTVWLLSGAALAHIDQEAAVSFSDTRQVRRTDGAAVRGEADVLFETSTDDGDAALHVELSAFGYKRIDRDTLRMDLAAGLPAAAVPSTVCLVDEFPITEHGKVNRKLLNRLIVESLSRDHAVLGANAEDAYGVLAIVREILGKMDISLVDNLVTYGADSLILARIIAGIRERVPQAEHIEFDAFLRAVLDEPSVSSLVSVIDERSGEKADTCESASAPQAEADTRTGCVLMTQQGDAVAHDDVVRIVIHGAEGKMDTLSELIEELRNSGACRVYGLVLPDRERYVSAGAAQLAETMAPEYARLIADLGYSRVQVIGHSVGGLIAAACASQLQAMGIEASAVVIDNLPSPLDLQDDFFSDLFFVSMYGVSPLSMGLDAQDLMTLPKALEAVIAEHDGSVPQDALMRIGGSTEFDALAHKMAAFHARDVRERAAQYAGLIRSQVGVSYDADETLQMMSVFNRSFRESDAPVPLSFNDVDYIAATDHGLFPEEMLACAVDRWRESSLGAFRVHSAQGSHYSIVHGEGCKQVVRVADEALALLVAEKAADRG